MMAGLLTPDSGTRRARRQAVTGPGPDRGVVFQNYSLLPWLTVYENVYLAVDQVFSATGPRTQKREHTEKYVALVNLTPARDKTPASCRAACASAWRWRARWPWTGGAAAGRAARRRSTR